MKYSIIYKPI